MALGFLEVLAPLATAAIQAGGAVGAAVIGSDAQKFVAKKQAQVAIQQQLSEQKALLAQAEAASLQAQVRSESSTQQIKFLVIAGVTLTLAGLGITIWLKPRRAA